MERRCVTLPTRNPAATTARRADSEGEPRDPREHARQCAVEPGERHGAAGEHVAAAAFARSRPGGDPRSRAARRRSSPGRPRRRSSPRSRARRRRRRSGRFRRRRPAGRRPASMAIVSLPGPPTIVSSPGRRAAWPPRRRRAEHRCLRPRTRSTPRSDRRRLRRRRARRRFPIDVDDVVAVAELDEQRLGEPCAERLMGTDERARRRRQHRGAVDEPDTGGLLTHHEAVRLSRRRR